MAAFNNEFCNDAAAARAGNPQHNARIIVATYQTLGVDRDDADDSFLTANYPHDYFSHIIIDECHRSAWGKWADVLRRNPDAVQIGLTATPRSFKYAESSPEGREDQRITANNYEYFGEPIYEYPIGQGIEDGYLAAMEVIKNAVFLDGILADMGVAREILEGKNLIDAETGQPLSNDRIREHYNAPSFEAMLLLPERVKAMCQDLFNHLVENGDPKQKTIIFCARDTHADAVANEMNNLYADWCQANGQNWVEHYAFKCTANSEGQRLIADFKGSSQRYFVATTVDLLTTGVDVPPVANIVFFKYVNSPIAFHQMVGRGTRIHIPTGKLSFRVYDYTNATRLFAEDFTRSYRPTGKPEEPKGPPSDPTIHIEAHGFQVQVSSAGRFIMEADGDGQALISLEEYKRRLGERLLANVAGLDEFVTAWTQYAARKELLEKLPEAGVLMLRQLEEKEECDLFDVLAELGYGQYARSREARAEAFFYRNLDWLEEMPAGASGVIRALASQFAKAGTEALESNQLFQTPEVAGAGGISALEAYGSPRQALAETKQRLFSL